MNQQRNISRFRLCYVLIRQKHTDAGRRVPSTHDSGSIKIGKKATVKISGKNTLEKQAYGEKHERKKYIIYVVINLYSMLFVR